MTNIHILPDTTQCGICGGISAEPAMVRVLLRLEWSGPRIEEEDIRGCLLEIRAHGTACSDCKALAATRRHFDLCGLDAALTAAGYDTQDKRDVARREKGIPPKAKLSGWRHEHTPLSLAVRYRGTEWTIMSLRQNEALDWELLILPNGEPLRDGERVVVPRDRTLMLKPDGWVLDLEAP
jgi:hypothetical protein